MRRKKPFTLLEVLVVMGIIIILAAILVGGVSVARRKSFDSATKAIIEKCALGLQNYRSRFGYFPPAPTTSYLSKDALIGIPLTEVKLADTDSDGIKDSAADARGNPLRYRCPGQHNPGMYDLWSVGPDGADDGGAGDDITNWQQ